MDIFDEHTSLLDIGITHVSPFLLVALISLAIPTEITPAGAYTFIIFLVILFALVIAKVFSYLFFLGAFWHLTRSARHWCSTKGRRLYNGMLTSWFGRFVFGLLAAHTVAIMSIWIYYNIAPMSMLRNTLKLLQAAIEHLADWKLLAIDIRDWTHSLVIWPVVLTLRKFIEAEIELAIDAPFVGLFVFVIFTAVFYAFYLLVHRMFHPLEPNTLEEIPKVSETRPPGSGSICSGASVEHSSSDTN
jgi:hypothetical protein